MKWQIFKDTGSRMYLLALLGLLIGTFGATSLTRPSNVASYGCFLLLVALFVGRSVVHKKISSFANFKFQPYDAIPMILLLVWLYGVARGLALGNNNVFRNFAGMTLYSIYYVFLLEKIDKFDILRCAIIAATINTLYMFGFFVWDKFFSAHFYSNNGFSYLDVRAYYSETLMLLAIPIVLLFYRFFSSAPGKVSNMKAGLAVAAASLYFYVFAFMQISLSKATAIFFVLSVLFFTIYFRKNVLRFFCDREFKRIAAIGFALCLSIYPLFVSMGSYTPWVIKNTVAAIGNLMPGLDLSKLLVMEDEAKRKSREDVLRIREIQSEEIVGDLTVLGKGLGARIGSGYSRDAAGYGFEANYWNLLHKFGIFALIIYATYLYIGFRIYAGFKKYKSRLFSLGSAAILTGIIMGFGNPVLMSPVMVTLQCMALYWLRDNEVSTNDRRGNEEN